MDSNTALQLSPIILLVLWALVSSCVLTALVTHYAQMRTTAAYVIGAFGFFIVIALHFTWFVMETLNHEVDDGIMMVAFTGAVGGIAICLSFFTFIPQLRKLLLDLLSGKQ